MNDKLDVFMAFTRGTGYPGIGGYWRGRENLYAERDDELLRSYELTRLHGRFGRAEGNGSGHQSLTGFSTCSE